MKMRNCLSRINKLIAGNFRVDKVRTFRLTVFARPGVWWRDQGALDT